MNRYFHGGEINKYRKRGVDIRYDFSINLSPLGTPKEVSDSITDYIREGNLSKYPDTDCTELRKKIAGRYDTDIRNVVVSNGASDLIYSIAKAVKKMKKKSSSEGVSRALIIEPSFLEYERSLSEEGYETEHYMCNEEEGFIPKDCFFENRELLKSVSLIFIANPSNPAGVLTAPENLEKLLCICDEEGVKTVIDESFIDFVSERDRYSFRKKIQDHSSLIVLNSFTKYYSMPDVRIGYVLCSDRELVNEIANEGQPWKVSGIFQRAALSALDIDDEEYRKTLIQLLLREKEKISAFFDENNIRYIAGDAGFILFFTEIPEFYERMLNKGILIRDCSNYYGLCKGCYRIAIKRSDENDVLLEALREIMQSRKDKNV
ncbi:MAG: aminotransferase class I/II-fold pyridoxal phosphate-dependent enzyme [Lachnospiraceae bacterium]|nr:aminotransferase class I/II-fold pyridoxal phosphate-dependent enzyme [Lachnospiraceae bacterium]